MENPKLTANYLDELHEELDSIDQLLYKVSKVLNSSQPSLQGKIWLYFWRTGGKDQDASPVFVRQAKNRIKNDTRTKYPERMLEKNLSRRALSRDQFERNYASTKAVLLVASELLTRRHALRESIKKIGLIARGSLNGNFRRSQDSETQIINIDNVVYRSLKDIGLEDTHHAIGLAIFEVNTGKSTVTEGDPNRPIS